MRHEFRPKNDNKLSRSRRRDAERSEEPARLKPKPRRVKRGAGAASQTAWLPVAGSLNCTINFQRTPLSFRGASEASEPGIHRQAPDLCLDSGFAPSARPGMTAEGFRPPARTALQRAGANCGSRRAEAREATRRTADPGTEFNPRALPPRTCRECVCRFSRILRSSGPC